MITSRDFARPWLSVVAAVMLAIAGLAGIARAVAASPADIPVEVFAQLPQVESPRFSPDGKYFAMIRAINGRRHVVIQPASGKGKSTAIPPIKELEIDWFAWANNQRLIVSIKFEGLRRGTHVIETRLIAINRDGSDLNYIVRPKILKAANSRLRGERVYAQIQDKVIDYLWNDPDHLLLALDSDLDGEDEVRRIDINDGQYTELGFDYRGIQDWITDQSGELRMGLGYLASARRMLYRSPVTDKWQDFTKSVAYKDGYRPLMFAKDPSHAYMSKKNASGATSIVEYDLIHNEVVDVLFSNENYSADHLIHDPRTRHAVGVQYMDDRPRIIYFDDKRTRRQRLLSRALPGMTTGVVSSTADDNLHIVKATSDTEPGMYYVFDEAKKQLHPLAFTYQGLEPDQLSPMKRVTYEARDGLEIPAYLTVPKGRKPEKLPLVVMPHGGPHARDHIGFDYWTQFLASRGYAVFQPNFRGSSGYREAFLNAGRKNWGLKMQDDLTDGTQWLIDQGIADPERICIVGSSYGGYAALMAAVKTPDLYKCAVSVNGVADIPGLIKEEKRYIGGDFWAKSIGDSREDAKRHKDASPINHVDRIRIPILMVHSKDDRTVNPYQSKAMIKKLKRAKKKYQSVELKNGGHGLDTAEARLITLKALEKFLAQYLGTPG